MILIVDNYDSFVFNVARYFEELGARPQVVRNDAVDAEAVTRLGAKALVFSPGPCAPKDAGASLDLIRAFSGKLPLLGICLGHQCIGEAFGGRTVHARTPMHGRASAIEHDGGGLFAGLPRPFAAGRYHSLIVELGEEGPLEVTARSSEGEIMALTHRRHPTFGVQFHPESILTPHGHAIIRAFLDHVP
ncbi:anthranilate synthase component II [Labrys monachus]|uniref:Anthranilate synthase/aminodeoxychorismate synthase-like glutamine amidotransferase n=1 Tax=Labrys monachus TaxID=217067 RepID=A0ABU0FHH5_9HYPH|nr:aminodeoxychorismate/anthranilate synthase component II [Labrys monachus]MDQ0394059.1 anthranilate synthase/aminodeoxychorismate synthase-like glutamine amidotransferase [Labrys monachus]